VAELTIETGWMCSSNEHWETKVTGSKGNVYTVTFSFQPYGPVQHDFECTCPQNKYRHKECKHIKSVKGKRCGWHQQFDGGDVDPKNPKCPDCNGEVKAIRWGA